MPKSDVIKPGELRRLVEAGVTLNPQVIADGPKWYVQVQVGMQHQALGARRGGVRFFKTLDGVASYLRRLGIGSWTTNAASWAPEQKALDPAQEALL